MTERYDIIIWWSEDDGCYVAEVPDLPGCMADGQSYEQAAANAEAAMMDWIKLAQELGRNVPEPRRRLTYA
jgi:predicted RNase H-like HicB family nuclease